MAFCISGNLHTADYLLVSESNYRAEVGRRLRAAIEVLGISQTEVGNTLGVSPSKMGNWLRGDHYPSQWFVKQFCDRYGITTEWIYRGIVSGMSAPLADALWNAENSAPADGPEPRPRLPPRERPPRSRPTPGGSVAKNAECGDPTKVVSLRPVPA
jgi:transcriptional regulator with XRE-family HTH domain